MRRSTLKILKILLVLGCVFSLYPLLAGVSGIGLGTSPYSPYNKGKDGLSKLKRYLKGEGYESETLLSSLKTLGRINKTGVLIIAGPTTPFGFQEVLTLLLDFVLKGGSVLLADDFGKANTLLEALWELSQFGGDGSQAERQMKISFNTSSVLCDAKSYDKSPARPTIKNFDDRLGIVDEQVDEVQTSFPTTFTLEVNSSSTVTKTIFPAEAGLMSSTSSSWLESDLSSARKGAAEPEPGEWGGIPCTLGVPLPLGGGMGRILLVSDPDIFSNALIDKKDNWLFSKSIIEWLSESTSSNFLIFDESHHSFLPYDPLFGLSLWFDLLTMVSASWILAPLVPILTFIFIMGYLPRRKRFRAVTLRHTERKAKGLSLYQSKVNRYTSEKKYRSAASTLLDLLTRAISRRYSVEIETTEELLDRISEIRLDLKSDELSSVKKLLTTLNRAKEGGKFGRDAFIEVMENYESVKDFLI
ncbi:MAG: hypothetical protein GWO20_11555 [Candidatus Korarchaeota archaeon]|nr:hypothetical protein [Candidatus Korarchaeota archaeon]NIU84079.1 hypothetical protein [Candidatus Thorarchaeota archaeon]NIW13407.1 hypothetical protein [Candidatus Thorarchaeota archaeon]NIW51532.1 hypothetical protein [Candidatus Korarchaeota archaeon]